MPAIHLPPRLWALLLGLATGAAVVPAHLPAQGTPIVSAEDDVQSLVREYAAQYGKWRRAYEQATEAARPALFATMPRAADWCARFQEFVAADPESEAARIAASWILRNMATRGRDLDAVVDTLRTRHIDAKFDLRTLLPLTRSPSPRGLRFLRALEAKNADSGTAGAACFSLAEALSFQATMARGAKQWVPAQNAAFRGAYGDEAIDHILDANPEELERRAVALYEKIQTTPAYGRVEHHRGTLADAARHASFALQKLRVGMVAPEIVGEDIDGDAMKLSDYRGKVVVLDFWGDW